MAILDLVEWADPSPSEIVHRVPEWGSGEFRLGSQLVVREPQAAVFYHNGQAADLFGPGRHTLHTENIPILESLIGIPFGGKTPFRTEVYFVSRRSFLGLKWGTPQPLALRDSDLGLVRLRAFGSFAMEVGDPGIFVNKIVGGQGLYTTADIVVFLRGIVVARLSDILGSLGMGLFDLPRALRGDRGGLERQAARGVQGPRLGLERALCHKYLDDRGNAESDRRTRGDGSDWQCGCLPQVQGGQSHRGRRSFWGRGR